MRALLAFFRANPQVLVLLLVCIVLGLGTFLAVIFGLVTAGSRTTSGEPSGSIVLRLEAASALPSGGGGCIAAQLHSPSGCGFALAYPGADGGDAMSRRGGDRAGASLALPP